MNEKIDQILDQIKDLCDSEIDRVVRFVFDIASANKPSSESPCCPHCGSSKVIKFGHRNGKQRFKCQDCGRSFGYTTNTLLEGSHYSKSIWYDFIRDTIDGESLDKSAKKFKFSHQTAFNMRHKVLMALQDLSQNDPIVLSGISEFDETFVLDSYKGTPVPASANRKARRHGAKASRPGISNEYIAICTGIERDGQVIAETVNRAKPSSKEIWKVFDGHVAKNTLVMTDGLRSYRILEKNGQCTVVNINKEKSRGTFNLNTVNSLHSFIKRRYDHYRGVSTKYLNRYNTLFALAYRCSESLHFELFVTLCKLSNDSYWHKVAEIKNHQLLIL